MHGESAEVSEEVVEHWMEKLPRICQGYADCDIYNVDETAIFYRMMPSRSYIEATEEKSGVKMKKNHTLKKIAPSAPGALGALPQPLP